jgi:arylsulfatase A-like enzyme
MNKTLYRFLGLWLFLVSLTLSAKSPNIVLVITDDQGYGDLSCHGNPVLKTPNIDQLHSESVRLTDYHVAPTCAPTRSALITGHWTNRTGVWHTIMGRSMLRANEVTIGTMLGKAGYATGMFGKWHLGDNYPYRPEDRGFQEVLRHGGGGVGQTPDYWDNAYFDGSYWHNGIPEPAKGFCTDVFFDYAIDFIESKKDADEPFFVYLCTNAPHGPMHSPEASSRPYQHLGTNVANFYGMIANIDDNVGRMRTYLQENNLEQNTIFIFTTDNGTSSGDKIFNNGMRGKKGSEYDGGHRVPFFIHWPGGGLTGGKDVSMITSYVDIVPTLLDLCGVEAPRTVKFDGVSLRSLLFNEKVDSWPDRMLVTDSQRVRDPIKWRKSSVMTDQYRLINGKELFDIDADKGQERDIATKHPEVVKRLRGFYDEWWAELEPTFSQTTEIYLGHPKANPVRLTSHDWIADGSTPWNQRHIRNAEQRPSNTGFWAVKVIESGQYDVELRRWPREIDHPIAAGLPTGKAVPGANAFRAAPGKAFAAVSASLVLGGQSLEKKIGKGESSVTFQVSLEPGNDELWAKFRDEQGNEMGAFYTYVRKR